MHPEAMAWVQRHATLANFVLDIGGRNVNGSPRHLYPQANYTAVDLYPGEGVDEVADVTEWEPNVRYDTVLCLEVLEHVQDWPAVIEAAHRLATDGGKLILTAAAPGRTPHSAIHGGPLQDNEHYANIHEEDLWTVLLGAWTDIVIDVRGEDIRAVATKKADQ